MEYSYTDLSKAIYYVLSLHPNKEMTIDDIYYELVKENACVDFTENNQQNSHIHNLHFHKSCYKMMSTYKNVNYNNIKNTYVIATTKKSKYNIDEIKNIILHNQSYQYAKYDDIYENGQTIVHILCIEGMHELLEHILSSNKINLLVENNFGQSLFDVVSINDNETMKILLRSSTRQIKQLNNEKIDNGNKFKQDLINAENILYSEISYSKKLLQEIYIMYLLFVAIILLFVISLF